MLHYPLVIIKTEPEAEPEALTPTGTFVLDPCGLTENGPSSSHKSVSYPAHRTQNAANSIKEEVLDTVEADNYQF
jgi:hypothetical protein